MVVIKENPSLRIQNRSAVKGNRDKKKSAHQPTNPQRSSVSLTDLPSNVLVEILARLPLRTLFLARSVCKTFVSLTTANPHFINLFSSNAPQILIFQFEARTPFYLIHMAEKVLDYKKSQLKPLFQLPKIIKQPNTLFLVNSCNGLLYFRQYGPDDYCSLVCNPVTREYIIVPDVDPKLGLDSRTEGSWLGFSTCTNQYKVLRIFRWKKAGRDKASAQVFVIGSDSWRHIDATLLWPAFLRDLGMTLVNGLMYWHHYYWPAVISFDFEREKFGEVALPPELQNEVFMSANDTCIGDLGGRLCLSCNNFYSNIVDLWVMRKCGNLESWTKDFVFYTEGTKPWDVNHPFQPLQFLGNGEILMQWRRNTLVCYDPRIKTSRYFRMHLSHTLVVLTPSFVPLNEALGVEKVLRGVMKRSCIYEEKWMKHMQLSNPW